MSDFKTEVLPSHAPPGNLTDLTEQNKLLWSQQIDRWMDDEIKGGAEGPCGVPRTPLNRFFNGTLTPFDVNQAGQDITWNAFPGMIKTFYPDPETRWAIAEYSRMVQDEYCEWSVTRDPNTNNIIDVTFTCEGPEYWQFIAQYQTDPKVATTVFNLYTTLMPDVGIQEDDLYLIQYETDQDGNQKEVARIYNPMNFWNCSSKTGTIAHLIHPSNSLGAEIDIVAQATVLRVDNKGNPITDQTKLINCSKYGQPNRNSDPTIGITVNNLVRGGKSVSVLDPVALYMRQFDTSNFTLNGTDIGEIPGVVQWIRGDITKGQGLRMKISIPQDGEYKGLTVSDIIAGDTQSPVGYAAQFVDYITMGVGGVALDAVSPAAVGRCPCDVAKEERESQSRGIGLKVQDASFTHKRFSKGRNAHT